jgi:hypothetical protein
MYSQTLTTTRANVSNLLRHNATVYLRRGILAEILRKSTTLDLSQNLNPSLTIRRIYTFNVMKCKERHSKDTKSSLSAHLMSIYFVRKLTENVTTLLSEGSNN